MNVWVRITRRRVKCYYCGQFIEAGEFQVVCLYYMKLRNSDKTWKKMMHFHAKDPHCWIDRAVIEVGQRHYTERRGRKAGIMSDVIKEGRLKIMRRRASVMQRIEIEMTTRKRMEKILHMTGLLDKLVVEIEEYGGAPESWK